MKSFNFLFAVLLTVFSITLFSQTSKEAAESFDGKDFKRAYEIYEKLYAQSPTSSDYKYQLALSALNFPDKKVRALELFEEIKKTDKSDEVNFYLGRAYHINYKFDEAITSYQTFLSLKGEKIKDRDKEMVKNAKIGIMNCNNGKEILAKKVVIDVKNIGSPINTNEVEGVPLISADGSVIIYTYVGEKSMGGLLNDQLQKDNEEGTYHEDVFISTKTKDGTWVQPLGISSLNTKGNDAAVALSPDGQTLFTFDSDANNEGDLFYSKLNGTQWSKPVRLNKNINSEFWEGSCSISNDGRFLYFSSDRPGGFGGIDIYVSEKKVNGDWGVAKNMGPAINTEYNEDAPFIHTDGITLFFSSEGHSSIGGYDIMYSMKKENNWIKPINMGIPLNTTDNDRYYVINARGDMGYFSANRSGGFGKQDIYSVTPGIFGEKPLLALLKGVVYADNVPTEGKIELVKEATNEVIEPYYSNSTTGNYLMAVTPGNSYKVKVTVKNMEPLIDEIDVENLPFFVELNKDFDLYSPGFANKKRQISIKDILDSLVNSVTNAEDFNNDVQINKIVDVNIKNGTIVATETPTLAAETPTVAAETTSASAVVARETSTDTSETPTLAAVASDAEAKVTENVTDAKTVAKEEVVSKEVSGSKSDNESSLAASKTTEKINPCNNNANPDFASLKGKSLNDESVYKELLKVAGSVCSEGMVFKVQIGAYRHPENYKYANLKQFGKPEVIDYPDGITRFTQFSYQTLNEAEAARKKVIAKGQKDAWITVFVKDKRYTLEEYILQDFGTKAIN
jgi:hypothetical protein